MSTPTPKGKGRQIPDLIQTYKEPSLRNHGWPEENVNIHPGHLTENETTLFIRFPERRFSAALPADIAEITKAQTILLI